MENYITLDEFVEKLKLLQQQGKGQYRLRNCYGDELSVGDIDDDYKYIFTE